MPAKIFLFEDNATDDDDATDANGENLGNRNVYRKLSNSELPQCAQCLPTNHCATNRVHSTF